MIFYKYKDYAIHKAEHEELIASVRELQSKFHQENKRLRSDDIEYLADWLTGHIMGQDMKLGFYLMNVM